MAGLTCPGQDSWSMLTSPEDNTSGWGDWLDEDDAIDMDMVEDVESQHKHDNTVSQSSQDDSGGVMILQCSGSSHLHSTLGEDSVLGRGCLSALLQQRCVCPWLKRLLDGDQTDQHITQDATTWPPIVFGAPCTLDMMLYNRHHFINAIRQTVFSIEQRCSARQFGSGDTQFGVGGEEIFQLRLQVVTFYNCLWGLVNYHLCSSVMTPNNVMECGRVACDLLELLQCVGPLHLLPQHVTAASSAQGNRCASTAYHLFHLHLDMRWWSLAILYSLEGWTGASTQSVNLPRPPLLVREPLPAGGGDGETAAAHHHTALGQALAFITWDLLTLMAREAAKGEAVSSDAGAGLPCSCCQELAVTVLHLTQRRHLAGRGQSYWDTIRSVFVVLLSNQDTGRGGASMSSLLASETATAGADQFPPPELRGLSCTVLFRLLLAAARLCCYDEAGHKIPRADPRVVAEPRLLRDLIQNLLGEKPSLLRNTSQVSTNSNSSSAGSTASGRGIHTAPSLTEERLRPALRCCLLLTVLWEGEPRAMDWAMLLWEKLFAKRLGSSFLLGGAQAVQELASVSPRISGWVSSAHQRCRDPADAPAQESSWLLFLRIIGCVVRRGGDKAWLIVKGRVLSKFSSRRLADLCSTGLRNLAVMLLTLAHCSAMRDTAELASELLCQSVPVTSPSVSGGPNNKLVMVVRAVLALAMMLTQAGCDASQVLAPLARLMAPLAQQFASNREVAFQREAGRVLGVYFTAAGELCALSTDLSLGQRSLYAPWLSGVVSACSGAELQQLLHGLHQTLASVLHQVARHRSLDAACLTAHQVVASIDRGVGVFLRTHSTSVSPPPELSAVAASLTLAHATLAPAVTTLSSTDGRVGPDAHAAWPSGSAAASDASGGNQCSDRTNTAGGNSYSNQSSNNNQNSFYRTISDNSTINKSVDCGGAKSSSVVASNSGGIEYKVNHKEAASSMFSYFLTTDHVNTNFAIEYMSGLFTSTSPSNLPYTTTPEQSASSPPVTITSVTVAPQQQELLVARLVRCAALRGSECPALLALLPRVCSLSLVSHYLPSCPPACPLTTLAALVKGMAREHGLATSVQNKHRVQSCCVSVLSGVEKAVQSVLQQTPPPPHLQQLLRTLGDMLRHAAPLLYVKSKGANSPLAVLLTSAVLSSASYRLDRPLPPHIVHALGPVLPQVLHGLGSLPLEHDTFLTRLTRTVITNYMHRYPANRHPFVVAVCAADTTSVSRDSTRRLRTVFVEVLRTDFLGHKWEGDYSRLHSALQVTALILRRVGGTDGCPAVSETLDKQGSDWSFTAALALLPLVLQLLLAAEDKTTKNCCIEMLRIVFTLTEKHEQPDKRALASAVEGLVQQRLCWQSERVFQLLNVLGALQPRLVAECLPAVRTAVRQTEEKRGTGIDQKLRQQYKSLEQRIGNRITPTTNDRTPL